MSIVNATEKNFNDIVLKSAVPVLVDFWAPWCGPCRAMAPVLDELALELDSKILIVKVDVEDQQNVRIAQQYGIRSIPNMKLFKKGEVVHDLIGFRPKEMIEAELKSFL